MINEGNKDELIEQYLLGSLDGDLLAAFREKMDSDIAFRQEVDLHKEMIRNIRLAGRKDWAAKLNTFHGDMERAMTGSGAREKVSSAVVPLRKWYRKRSFLVAATVTGLVIICSLLYNLFNNNFDSERVFLAYYEPYTALDQGKRGLPEDTPDERRRAFAAYHQSDYPKSIMLFKNILARGEDENVLFYLGNAYLSDSQERMAENTFRLYLGKYKEYEAEAQWYLALSYLRQKKIRKARNALEQVIKARNDYSERASEILKQIEQVD